MLTLFHQLEMTNLVMRFLNTNQNNYSNKFLNIDDKYETGSVIITLKMENLHIKLSNVAWDFIPLKPSYDEILIWIY